MPIPQRADAEPRPRRPRSPLRGNGAFVLLVGLLIPGPGLVAGPSARAADPPNIVLIISDDQAWNDHGFMGHPRIRTPHLDRLAQQSRTFTRGYVPTSLCRPSLMTLVTGLYPHQHGVVGNDPAPPADIAHLPRGRQRDDERYHALREAFLERIDRFETVPALLREAGYLSHQSGKWWEGHYRRGGFTHGMTHGDRTRGGRHGDEGLRIGREGMEPIFDFIDEALEADRPFFVWYAPFLPHTPHNPPQRHLEPYRPYDLPDALARYYAMCSWFDETCGELLDHLEQRGLADDTLVLYICDNGWIQRTEDTELPVGWAMGEPFAPRSKRSPHEGGIRTPLMVRWPGRVEPVRDERTLVHAIDLAPTILAAAGLEVPGELPGVNLLDDEALDGRDALFGDVYHHDVPSLENPAAGLRFRWVIEGRWKLILPHAPDIVPPPPELYDLEADPWEEQDLARERPDLVDHLTGRIEAWWSPGP